MFKNDVSYTKKKMSICQWENAQIRQLKGKKSCLGEKKKKHTNDLFSNKLGLNKTKSILEHEYYSTETEQDKKSEMNAQTIVKMYSSFT